MVIMLKDDDCNKFLSDQGEHDGSFIDPSYKYFLEHLKEDGESYVLDIINEGYGLPTSLKYEGEDELSKKRKVNTQISSVDISCDGCGDSTSKRLSRRSCPMSGKVAGNFLNPDRISECSLVDESYHKFLSLLKCEGNSLSLEYEPGLSFTYEKEIKTGFSADNEEEKETSNSSESLGTESPDQSECSVVDDSYWKFLSLLHINDNLMSLEYEPGVFVTYEDELKTGPSVAQEKEKPSTDLERMASEDTCQFGGFLVDESYQKFLSCLNIEGSVMSLDYGKGSGISVKREEEEEKRSTDSDHLVSEDSSLSECLLVDESYQKFLNLLKIKGNSMTLEYKPGGYVLYEQEKEIPFPGSSRPEEKSTDLERLATEGSSQSECFLMDECHRKFPSLLKLDDSSVYLKKPTDSEILATASTIYSDEQGLPPYKGTGHYDLTMYEDGNSFMLSPDYCDSSEFRKELLVILNKPYDENEYQVLWKEATMHKPVIREKHLRSVSKSYPTKKQRLSYLDHFQDLRGEIEHADCYRRLTLLRGFFYWIENLCRKGAFKPWQQPKLRP